MVPVLLLVGGLRMKDLDIKRMISHSYDKEQIHNDCWIYVYDHLWGEIWGQLGNLGEADA
jgi:hypothetical protein